MHVERSSFAGNRYHLPLITNRAARYLLAMTLAIGLPTMAFPAFADGFNGSNLLSGTTERIIEINPYKIVDNVDPATIGLPKKFIIDLEAKLIRPSKESVIRKTIALRHIERIEDKLIFQGVDHGVEGVNDSLAWSLTLSKKGGNAVLAATGDGVAYVVFGKIVPLKNHP